MTKLKEIYSVQKVHSYCQSLDWQGWVHAIEGFGKNAWIVASLHYGVFVGSIKNGTIQWYGDNDTPDRGIPDISNDGFPEASQIVELRVFDADKEAFYWRNGIAITGRIRKDTEGDEVLYTEARLFTRGVVSGKLFASLDTRKGDSVFLVVRNYVGENSLHQSGYVDCRFVNFINSMP